MFLSSMLYVPVRLRFELSTSDHVILGVVPFSLMVMFPLSLYPSFCQGGLSTGRSHTLTVIRRVRIAERSLFAKRDTYPVSPIGTW